uniref:Rho guanine nucleotide exchange factor 18-like n=1 Tax=Gouania willdenowi TaxID=441366 RepID=A0A8C5HFY0_GOUWI
MTVHDNPTKLNLQPVSSCYSGSTTRAGAVQMDETDALRLLRIPSDDSLSSSVAEAINLEDSHYSLLQKELKSEAEDLEAESWTLTVHQKYLKNLSKEAIKREDVIYELIQTEMHHVRTLKILLHVYMHELRKSLLIEEGKLEWLFMRNEELLSLHQNFLKCLRGCQKQSQEEGSDGNYQITQLGDILISQFSGPLGEKMRDCYTVFCCHHIEAMTFYKEQIQNNKKLQNLIKKVGQLTLVRRLGIPECFLLVTQRIMKYPVLVERIIQNTEVNTEEYKALVESLALMKDFISHVNTQVSEYEKATRLRNISLRLEPKSVGRLKDGRVLRREELLQGDRLLLYEGLVTWKSSGRHKDVHAVLLSDMLLFLQEKDQKFVFAAVDNRPPVISLQKLIVREVAHEEKAMFLICACTISMPEMYEIYTSSREERVTWTTNIRKAVECHREETYYREHVSQLQHYQDLLKSRDDVIKQSLIDKQRVFAALYEDTMEQEAPHSGLLLRGDTLDLQQGETLLKGAINEVENLQNLLLLRIKDPNLLMEEINTPAVIRSTESSGDANNSQGEEDNDWSSNIPVYHSHATLNLKPRDADYYSEDQVDSADDETDNHSERNCHSCSTPFHEAEVCDSVILLAQRLYSLQAVIVQQDSQIELQHAFHSMSKQPTRPYSNNVLLEQEKQRNLEKHKEELANLHKVKAQHQEEQQRWEKERERQRIQQEALEMQLQQREEECRRREAMLSEEKVELERHRESYQQDLERLRESIQSVEKEKERLTYEKEQVEKIKSKYVPGNYDEAMSLYSNPSFRGSVVNGGGPSSSTPKRNKVLDVAPKVPPRKESMSIQTTKAELPIHLLSTTNQVLKSSAIHQQIPTKLATLSKGKEKGSKTKTHHQRTHSAAHNISGTTSYRKVKVGIVIQLHLLSQNIAIHPIWWTC